MAPDLPTDGDQASIPAQEAPDILAPVPAQPQVLLARPSQRNRSPLAVLIGEVLTLLSNGLQGTQAASPFVTPPAYTAADFADRQVFIAPAGQTVFAATELSGGIAGLADKDSYLFMTEDVTSEQMRLGKGYRAFIVPKDDPTKQHEVALTDGKLTIGRDFRATLAGGHDLVMEPYSATLDGHRLRIIEDRRELESLVKARIVRGEDSSVDESRLSFNGDSWVLQRKDLKTGRIEKFTQEGTGNLGRVEIIQGDPISGNDLSDWLGNNHLRDWLTNGETKRTPISSSKGLVSLPSDLREDAGQTLVGDAGLPLMGGRAFQALEKLTGDHNVIASQIRERNAELTDDINRGAGVRKASSLLRPGGGTL